MQEKLSKEKIDAAYAPLKDFMKSEHGLKLDTFQMNALIDIVEAVQENINELYRMKCDVIGCDKTPSTQGVFYAESGYWCLCSNHSDAARASKALCKDIIPNFKPEAIERNLNHTPKTTNQ